MVIDTQVKYISDLEELSRKTTQDDEALSDLLNRYRACLNHMDFEDAIQCVLNVDFSVAGQVVDRSLIVYSKKIDKLEETTENLLHDIILHKPKPVGNTHDAHEPEQLETAPVSRRRQRRIRDSVDEDDFYEIENQLKNCNPQNMQQSDENNVTLLDCKFYHSAPMESNKRRLDVRLKKIDDKDKSRLRDWFLSDDFVIMREIFTEGCTSEETRYSMNISDINPTAEPKVVIVSEDLERPVETESINGVMPMCCDDAGDVSYSSSSEDEFEIEFFHDLNRHRDLIVDDAPLDLIIDIKLKPGKTTRLPCSTCNSRKPHAVCGKVCKQLEHPPLPTLDAYFQQFVGEKIRRPILGPIRDKELTEAYQAHIKQFAQFKKQNDQNLNLADDKFNGFDGDDDDFDRCNDSVVGVGADIPSDDADFDLPQADSVFHSIPDNVVFPQPEASLNETQADNTEKTREMLMRISKWHESLRSKIVTAEERGVLNMDLLACRIMDDFPKDKPKISFRELVQDEPRHNVARYFLTCLQLANEGNLLIEPADQENSMFLERLRDVRLKKVDEYNPDESREGKIGKKRKNQAVDARKRRHH